MTSNQSPFNIQTPFNE